MNFYHARYKRQVYDGNMQLWKDTYYDNQGIIVIANNYDDAKLKIEKSLPKVERGKNRAVLISDVVECIGLDRRHGFDGSFEIYPIIDT